MNVAVAQELRQQIVDGRLVVGQKIPSETALCTMFGASRGTVRAALATLRHEGWISGGQGRSPVVREAVAPQSFETFMSFTSWAEKIGRTPGQRTIEIARRGASAIAAQTLGIAEGDAVVDVLRLRTLDGTPAMLERSSFIEPVGRLLFDFDPDGGSIYAYLTSRGVDLSEGRHTIDAVAADDVDAMHLDVEPGAPLLRERRRAVNSTGACLECADDRYRPDRVAFTIDNALPNGLGVQPDLRIIKEIS